MEKSIHLISLLPNIWLMFLVIQQYMDIEGMENFHFFEEHPWYVFTAMITFLLCSANFILWLIGYSTIWNWFHHRFHVKKSWRIEMDFLVYSLDAAWGTMWLLQFIVQVLLPPEHRPFKLSRVASLVLVYGIKLILTILCCFLAYKQCANMHSVAGAHTSTSELKIPYKTISRKIDGNDKHEY